MNLSVELAPRCKRGLFLANPVMAASGTFGYGLEMAKELDIQRLGAHNKPRTPSVTAVGLLEPILRLAREHHRFNSQWPGLRRRLIETEVFQLTFQLLFVSGLSLCGQAIAAY